MNLLVDGRAGFVTAPIYPQESMDPEIEHNYYEKKKSISQGIIKYQNGTCLRQIWC